MTAAEAPRVGARVRGRAAGRTQGHAAALLRGLAKRFGSLQALADVDLDIEAGEIHCLLGENGAGKSTLCNMVFGVYQPDVGEMPWPAGRIGRAARRRRWPAASPWCTSTSVWSPT